MEAGKKNEKKLARATTLAHTLSPSIAVTFVAVYGLAGIYNVMNPDIQV
jgi:hypothetical protein